MAFTIDAAVDVLKVIDKPFQGHSRIFAFQRDGQLYLIGGKAVAIIGGGVSCSPYRGYTDATLDSYVPKPFRGKSPIIDESGHIIESEAKYFAPLCRDKDGRENNLAELLEIGEIARKQSLDDGRIRMVSHGTSYHSHKHGYATDGVDVSVTDARVMMRMNILI